MSIFAGFGSFDITPSRQPSLVGYGQRLELHGSGNAGILDPLHVRALALSSGGETLLLLSFDLCVLTPPVVDEWRLRLAGALDLPTDAILLASTHTHSGPHARVATGEDIIFQLTTQTDEADLSYGTLVLERAILAAREALSGLRPHEVFWNHGPLGFGYKRRVATDSGIRMCWNPKEFPELRPSPSPDPHCGALIFRDEEGGEIVLWSAAAHPVVLGKESNVVSADWPGYACNQLDGLHPNRRSIFVLGPCGEVHPWIATQGDPAGVAAVGSTAAHFVDLLSHGTQTPRPAALKRITRDVNGMPLTAWNICGVILLGAPVELFASLSLELRRVHFGPLLIATLANGWQAYFPDRAAFHEGVYEAEVARACGRKPGDGEALLAELDSLARSAAQPPTEPIGRAAVGRASLRRRGTGGCGGS